MGVNDLSNVQSAVFATLGSNPEDARLSFPATRELTQKVFAALGEQVPSWCSPSQHLQLTNDGSLKLTGNRYVLDYSLGDDGKVAKYNYRDDLHVFERDLESGVTPEELAAAIKVLEDEARKKSV